MLAATASAAFEWMPSFGDITKIDANIIATAPQTQRQGMKQASDSCLMLSALVKTPKKS
jgi:hypothetical protein